MSVLSMKDHQCTTTYYRDIMCIGGLGTSLNHIALNQVERNVI